jgi:hypothetical protein
VLLAVGAVAGASSASAASCPSQTYLSFNHLAYAAVSAPPAVQLPPSSSAGGGTIDEPQSANGCHRARASVQVLTAGSIDPHVAVLVAGRPGTIFVIGQRCAGFVGSAYWGCLLRPLVFHGLQFTGTSYPSQPPPRKAVPLGPAIGTARYHGQNVTVRRIEGVDPSLALGISGQPSDAFLSPRACPYSGFSNVPQYDDLLRCLQGPVWFTFDPPGSEVGGTIVARSDRPVSAAVAGAAISLIRLPVLADLVPPHNGQLAVVGHVSEQVSLSVPKVPPGLYEAVVSCAACASRTGVALYPAGSFLVTAKPNTSLGIRIVSYALLLAFLVAAFFAYRTYRRRRQPRRGTSVGALLGQMLMGPGPAGSSRRGRNWSEDAAARPTARESREPPASPRATRVERTADGRRRRKSARRRTDH